jgi:hypothetical protein
VLPIPIQLFAWFASGRGGGVLHTAVVEVAVSPDRGDSEKENKEVGLHAVNVSDGDSQSDSSDEGHDDHDDSFANSGPRDK